MLHGRIQRLVAKSFAGTDAGHGAPALALDEDLALVAFPGTDFPAVEIIRPQEPFAVPSVLLDGVFHRADRRAHRRGIGIAQPLQQLGKILSFSHEQPGDHQ